MLVAQGALHEHADRATPLLKDLELRERALPEVVRLLIPTPSGCNRARLKLLSDRNELLQVLAAD